MTRREAREHCFKMLFCQDFYPAEEKNEQLERYFDAPIEDVTNKEGVDEVLHDVTLNDDEKNNSENIFFLFVIILKKKFENSIVCTTFALPKISILNR